MQQRGLYNLYYVEEESGVLNAIGEVSDNPQVPPGRL